MLKANIAGVELFAIVYCWPGSQLSYFVLSCGKTVRHVEPYVAKFTDRFDNTQSKELPRPAVIHTAYHFLPLVGKFNKDCQCALALEKCWPTRSC